MLSIAVDIQGAEVVKPFTQKFGVTFPVAVDTADVFGAAFGLKAIPVTFFVDEVGLVRLQGGGPNPTLLRDIETLLAEPMMSVRGVPSQLPSAQSRAELENRIARSPEDWRSRLALARLHDEERRQPEAVAQLEAAAKLQPRSAEIQFAWGLAFLRQGQKEQALARMKRARDFDPENWRIRKQIWAIENPGKFYNAESPDYGWQKEQLDRERTGLHQAP